MISYDNLRAVDWQNGKLHLLDQRQLPHQQTTLILERVEQVTHAIKEMVVRGAPAIGIAAGYGVVLAAAQAYAKSRTEWQTLIEADLDQLAQARPTAVNLIWALQRLRPIFPRCNGDPVPLLLAEARRIHQEDIAANHQMGELGASLLPSRCRVLTHCNAGALATGGYGTALGVVRHGYSTGKIIQVYADETRPWLQGARLTAWELLQEGIPVTLLADCAAATLMRQQKIDWVIVGADRIAANGDVANKIGTYNLAVLARYHGVKLMVVAPTSTLDLQTSSGDNIVIEERSPQEILTCGGQPIAPAQAQSWNPAFDVTPAELIDVIVTERGIIEKPDDQQLAYLT